MSEKRHLVVIGGGFSGLMCARDMHKEFNVTVIDAKEFFEYTPGILRAYAKPAHYDSLAFTLAPVLRKMHCNFIWGEVRSIDGDKQTLKVKRIHQNAEDEVAWDYCIISSGCNFNFLHKWGESLWFPTIYEESRPASAWKHIDERFIEGRRRHIYEEYDKLSKLNQRSANILVCGAGFIGVEWATELQYFFPKLSLTIIDFLPNCLGPLPKSAQSYCDRYMKRVGINTFYGVKYEPNNWNFWQHIGLPHGADETYYCMGVKASNHFMPKNTLSDKGPGGGGWILINKQLQVTTKDDKVCGNGNLFAIGDCNFSCVGGPDDWKAGKGIAPIPKISYPAEEQAAHACTSIRVMDAQGYGKPGNVSGICCLPSKIKETWWPWGAGMFATSLGPHDACFVLGATSTAGSGYLSLWGWCSAVQKEIIEHSKVSECRYGWTGRAIWHFVHHTPVHLWGKGRFQ